jgi:hypothetical protein
MHPVKHLLTALTLCVALAGCVSPAERELRSRSHRYDVALSQIKWGSTRADLQRLFPPRTPDRPFTKGLISVPGPNFSPELYAIDADFAVPVSYYYQHVRRQSPPSPSHPQAIDPALIDALLSGKDVSYRIYPRPADQIACLPLRVQRR